MQADPVVVARSARPAAPAPPAAVVAPPVEPEVVGKPAEPPVATKHGEERPNLTDCVMPDALMTALRQALPETSLVSVALQDATVVDQASPAPARRRLGRSLESLKAPAAKAA